MVEAIKTKQGENYRMPTRVYFGRGGFFELAEIISQFSPKRVLLISAEHLKKEPAYNSFVQELSKSRSVFEYSAKITTSDFQTINDTADYARRQEVDLVIGIGGGSVLDTAKCAAALVKNPGTVEEYVRSKTKIIMGKGIYFVAVPTTAGTGSEVTPWATVWGDDEKKYSLSSPDFMFPDIALVDPALTDSLLPFVTATTGIDALCQAVEAYWNVHHNPVSDEYALEAIKVIMANLETAVNKPATAARDKMAWGSLVSGLAFSNTQTTLCHSVSYPITIHWGIVHGQATAITLPLFIEYIVSVLEKNRRETLLKTFSVKNEKEAADKVKNLMSAIHLKIKLSELDISNEDIDIIVAEGFDPERTENSPRILSSQELKTLLKSIL